jgi:hypothetical protein
MKSSAQVLGIHALTTFKARVAAARWRENGSTLVESTVVWTQASHGPCGRTKSAAKDPSAPSIHSDLDLSNALASLANAIIQSMNIP